MSADLARRLVALGPPRFRWLPGMHSQWSSTTSGTQRLIGAFEGPIVWDEGGPTDGGWVPDDIGPGPVGYRSPVDPGLPDLDDPATRGCVRQLVCDATGLPGASAVDLGGLWALSWGGDWECVPAWIRAIQCPTEMELYVAILEAAP